MSFIVGKNAVVVCLGDSITAAEDGYVTVMQNLISAGYPERNIRIVNAGRGGNRSTDMLARLQEDVVAHNPNVVTISAGINDVWKRYRIRTPYTEYPNGDGAEGVSVEVYEAVLGEMVDILRETTEAEIVLMSPTLIGEDIENPNNKPNATLKEYVAAVERVAHSRNTLLAPAHEAFIGTLQAGRTVNPDFCLTTDGVHLNPIGNHVLALTVLATLGFAGLGG